MMSQCASLEADHLAKRFGGLVAVKDISLKIRSGEILGLIGPNGSGKSTVMKLIMGIERTDAGSVRIDGREVAGLPSYKIARFGVGLVFQHSRPLHRLTVLENIKLALLPDKLTRLYADPHIDEHAKVIAARVGLQDVLDRLPSTLPFADLRRIEIAKAIARDPHILLIDEPFAGLTQRETAAFSSLIAELRDDARAILLVDHNVKSVARLVDRVHAMYLGETIAEGSAEQVMQNENVRRVYLGGSIQAAARQGSASASADTPVLELKDVSVHYGKAQALENVSIHINPGEFVALVGLNGAGKTTLFNAVSGLVPYAGEIRQQGRSLRSLSAAKIARGGIVQAPEGRELFTDMTVRENLDLAAHRLTPDEIAAQIAWLFELFPILRERQTQMAGTLSGGEQQMLTIARALMMKPRLLILDEPTIGLAPIILEQISHILEKLHQTTGLSVLLGEQNVTFAIPHADRVYVLEHARIVWEGPPAQFATEAGQSYL